MASIPLCSDNLLTTHAPDDPLAAMLLAFIDANHMQLTMQYGIHA